MTAYPYIAERLFGHAHAIEPTALRAIIEGPLGRRVLAGERIDPGKQGKKAGKIRRGRASALVEAEEVRGRDGMSEYALTDDGVAIISIAGVLSRRFDWLAALCGFATYEGIGASLASALADFRVKAVLLDVDSPGGQIDGMLDMADQILAARAKMPVWAVANSLAASAAYALAGSAEKLFLPRLGVVGSIGAVMLHIDVSARDQAEGLKYTAIYSGARKIDGWDHAALSSGAREAAQARIDHCRQALCDLVGRQGRISAKAALATEAACYSDDDARNAGLADGVQNFEATLAALTDQISGKSQSASAAQPGASDMTTQKEQLLNGASPTAVLAGQQPAPEAAAPAAVAPPAPAANLPNPPKPGEKCQTCGQVMPDDDDDDAPTDPDSKAPAAAAAAGYTVAMAIETMDLCAIAKRPVSEAKAFVAAKTPIASVRAALVDKAAAAADALAVDGTARPSGRAEAEVAALWDQVVNEQNAKLPGAKR
jgi:ClpP class serine protease